MERPILFSSEMVRAILDGRKTQTRRIIKPQPPLWTWNHHKWDDRCINVAVEDDTNNYYVICPHGKSGDFLWVRESLRRYKHLDFLGADKYTAQYMATDTAVPYAPGGAKEGWCGTVLWQWKNNACPSIHMPRWACRIVLKITNIRVERLQDISEDDAWAEGIGDGQLGRFDIHGVVLFKSLWDSINGHRGYPWSTNPWVWVIEFEREPV